MLQQRGVTPATLQQQFQAGASPRFPALAANRPTNIEQYEQLLQKQAQLQAARQTEQTAVVTQAATVPQRPAVTQQTTATTTTNENTPNDQEIPDNVTAELEKLEQETGTMVELQGVSEILGGLGEDDDELLGNKLIER